MKFWLKITLKRQYGLPCRSMSSIHKMNGWHIENVKFNRFYTHTNILARSDCLHIDLNENATIITWKEKIGLHWSIRYLNAEERELVWAPPEGSFRGKKLFLLGPKVFFWKTFVELLTCFTLRRWHSCVNGIESHLPSVISESSSCSISTSVAAKIK